jgi:hypothetical protein
MPGGRTLRSARGKALEKIMLDNFAARRARLPLHFKLHCGRHAATARGASLAWLAADLVERLL